MRIRHILMTSAAAIPGLLVAAPAHAQSITLDPPPVRQPLDENGVDLSSGGIVVPSSTLAIGGADGLVHSRYRVGNGWRHNYILSISEAIGAFGQPELTVQIGGSARVFLRNGSTGEYIAMQGEKGSLVEDTSGYTYTADSGASFRFDKGPVTNGESYYGPVVAVGTSITEPGGQVTTLAYRNSSYPRSGMLVHVVRLQSVRSITGYMLKFAYAANTASEADQADSWYRVNKVTAINNSLEYCDPVTDSCALTRPWPYLTYALAASGNDTVETVTDILGREARFTTDAARRLKAVKRPGESADGMVIAYDASSRVDWITRQGSYTRDYDWSTDVDGNLVSVSTDALGRTRTVVSQPTLGLVLSNTNALSETTTYEYDANGWTESVTAPEGNVIDVTRDARGRVTKVEHISKDGATRITTSATYPALDGAIANTCANAVTCDKPLSTTDANGHVTTYAYDQTHGGVISVTRPADDAGIAPVTTYAYADKTPRYLNAAGTLVNAPSPVVRLVSVKACRTASTCTGTADEMVSELAYDNMTAPNLQPVSTTVRTGANTLASTTAYTYTPLGNVATIDGPVADDITTYRYDAAGQQVGTISPDPDGTGALPRLASRTTYNADGQVTKSETGTVAGTTDTDWAAFAPTTEVRTSYDAFGRVATTSQVLPGSTAQYSMAQYSYDYAGRPECTALRMNAPSTGTALPASACDPMTEGAYGPDRIERRYYDTADRVTQVFSGVGTPLQQQTAALEYTDNGRTSAVIDARGNRTEYVFDGYDRPVQIVYPHPSAPGTVNTADYEQVAYDPAGNVVTYRNRTNETINLHYDDLGRLVRKVVPSRTGLAGRHTRNGFYAYDLFGNMTEARFGNDVSGIGFSYSYDVLGRLTGVDDEMGTTVRTLGYEYDAAGRRTALVHPDGQRITYEYDPLSRLTHIRRNGSDLLVKNEFLATGELDRRMQGNNGYRTNFYYDGARRARRELIGLGGSSWDRNETWEFNPANQVTTQTQDNSEHHWDKHPDQTVDYDYTANGLNQYTQAGAETLSYDANGNLAADALDTYTYDVENRLVSISGYHNVRLSYDPLGRLYEVANGAGQVQRVNLYDPGSRPGAGGDALIGEYGNSGTMTARYVHGLASGDDPIAAWTGSAALSPSLANVAFLYRDRLGSVVMSSADGASGQTAYTYDEFGVHGTNPPPRFGYTGQVYVPEAGLYYYKARMYSPGLGRFMQADPIGFAAGMNWYAYVGNDPVNGVDPTGLYCVLPDPEDPNDSEEECHRAGGTWYDGPNDDEGTGPTITVTASVYTITIGHGASGVAYGVPYSGGGVFYNDNTRLTVIEERSVDQTYIICSNPIGRCTQVVDGKAIIPTRKEVFCTISLSTLPYSITFRTIGNALLSIAGIAGTADSCLP